MSAKFYLLIAFLVILTIPILAQTTIAIQDFETVPASPTLTFSNAGGTLAAGSGFSPASDRFLGAQSFQSSNETATVTFATVNTTAFSSVFLRLRLASFSATSGNGADGGDNVQVEISTDGGTTWSNEYQINGNSNARWDFNATGTATTPYDGNNTPFVSTGAAGTQTNGISTITVTGLPSITTLRVRVTMLNNNVSETWVLEDVELLGTPAIVCPHTLVNFAPTNGPVGTEVTINGTGFTGATTVDFNGTAATVEFINSTTLIATVPNGTTTGDINIIESSCTITSPSPFTLENLSGSCSSSLTDIIISEVYDNSSGNLGYIEIYNGTSGIVDLTDYQIDRYADLSTTGSSHSYTFPGGTTINPGQVLFGKVSNDANVGGATPNFTFTGSTSGFNADDRLELVLTASTTIIDDFHDLLIGSTGYVYRRNTTVTGPNPAFNASEWTTASSGDVSDLGLFAVSSGTPNISAQPIDVVSCPFSMSVTATAGNGGAITYQWKYNDGIAASWTDVSALALSPVTVAGETAATLNLSGDLSSIAGYQFYCEITENGSCVVASDAAQFDNTNRFYRSFASGNWSDPTTWETATSAAGPWSPACSYPVFDNSDYIHVLNTHQVDVDIDITADEMVIESGGTVSINNNMRLAFNNGIGIDLEVIGTLIDNGAGGGNGINFSALNATWILDANGEIIKTGSSSAAQYRDNYEGGISTIPATATWRYRFINNGNISLVNLNMFYPNLYFESTAGFYSFSSPNELLSGVSGFSTVKGSLFVGSTGTDEVEVFNINTNATTMQILGDVVIGGNAAVGISKFENNNGTTTGTGIEVFGNIQINANGLLDFDNASSAILAVIRLHGNWTDNASANGFDEVDSRVEFVGSTAQNVSKTGLAGVETFQNVVVNKPAGILQVACNEMRIDNDMIFTSGIVQTTLTETLVFDENATTSGASNTSHVNGPVIKETSNSLSTSFTFPTGKAGLYGAIGIETTNFVGEHFRAEYYAAGYGQYNVNPAELDHVSQVEWWDLHEMNLTTAEARVTLHWNPWSLVLNIPSLRVAHFYTQAPSAINQWEAEGAAPTIAGGSTLASGAITSAVVTSFSPFTLGDIIDNGSLPLDLISFEATKINQTALLEWEVANEKASDRYCLQRSIDASNFETLYCIEATEDQSTAYYSYLDESPLTGDNYYRLAQTDYLGDLYYSPVRVLNFEMAATDINIYPNPAQQNINISLEEVPGQDFTVEVIDVLGRVLLTEHMMTGYRNNQLDIQTLIPGNYMLRIQFSTENVITKKFSIVR